jgi:predicted outer membrane protein
MVRSSPANRQPLIQMGESVMTLTQIIVTLFALGSSAIAIAQTLPNAGFIDPSTPGMETGKLAPNYPSGTDKLFLRQAAIGGRAEVELGQLAQQKGHAQAVRDFGERMVSDHSQANDHLMRLGKDVSPSIPKEPDPVHKRMRDELNQTSGKDFDIAYMGLDHRIGHFMLFEVASEARVPAPPRPKSRQTWSAASVRKSVPLLSSRQAG